MFALIQNDEIRMVCHQKFEVHPDFSWVNCPVDCKIDWTYKDGVFIAPEPEKEFVDYEKIQREKIEALWQFCDTGDKSAIEEIKSREGKL